MIDSMPISLNHLNPISKSTINDNDLLSCFIPQVLSTPFGLTLKKYGDYYGPRIKPLIIPYEDSRDIDNIFDLFITEIQIFQWEKYKKRFSKNNSNIK